MKVYLKKLASLMVMEAKIIQIWNRQLLKHGNTERKHAKIQ